MSLALDDCTVEQAKFWSLKDRRKAFVGGIGSGKTFAGAIEVLRMPANSVGMIVGPTYSSMKKSTLESFFEIADPAGLIAKHLKADRKIKLVGNRTVHYGSADNPDSLRGPNLGWFWGDEVSYWEAKAWRIMAGRLRKSPGRCWLTMTPRGKKHWTYRDLFGKGRVEFVTARTASNRFNREGFAEELADVGDMNWQRQEYGGEFIDEIGTVFAREWFPIVDRLPNMPRITARSWDCAATPGGGDFSASIKGDLLDGLIYLSSEVRGQWGPGEVDTIQRQTARIDGPSVPIVLEQEGGSSGKRVNHYVRVSMPGHTVIDVPASGSKYQRAIPFAKLAAEGRIVLVNGPWVADWLEEVVNFTGEETRKRKSDFGDELPVLPDDRIDAASLVVNYLMPFMGAGAYGGLDA
jgi:predicted phage terminase large subunit-like protein